MRLWITWAICVACVACGFGVIVANCVAWATNASIEVSWTPAIVVMLLGGFAQHRIGNQIVEGS
jgi:hypothetical protein